MLDTSESPLLIERVVSAQQLYDAFPDDQIATILVIDESRAGGAVQIRIVGEEVPQWLQ